MNTVRVSDVGSPKASRHIARGDNAVVNVGANGEGGFEAYSERARAPLKVPAHVLAAARGDATVLLHVERGRYYTLNETGSRIWGMICEGQPFDAIVERLRDEYHIDVARAESDATSLIGRLLSESLVECGE